MAPRSKRVAAPEAAAPEEAAPQSVFGSARAHEVIALVLPLLSVGPRVRCAAVCRAWRDAAALPSVWTELDFREEESRSATVYARPSIDTLALVALCRRAGASLRALHLDTEASVYTLSAASVIYALQTAGACVGLQRLSLPASDHTVLEYDCRPDQLLLTPAQAVALKAACPALRETACGVLCESDADAACAAAALPGPLVLCFARSWCDSVPGEVADPVAPAHWLAPSVAGLLLIGDSAEEPGRPTEADVVRLLGALRAAPAASLRYLDVVSDDFRDVGATALAAALRSETCTLQKLFFCTPNLPDDSGKTVMEALASNKSLSSLRLHGPGELGDDTVDGLCIALRQNTTLHMLELEAHFDDIAMAILGRSLSENSTLKKLCLVNLHPQLGALGMEELAAVLRPDSRCSLKIFKISVCRRVHHAAVDALCAAAAEPGAAPALTTLHVHRLDMEDDGALQLSAGTRWLDSVCALLRSNVTLQELRLENMFDSDAALNALAAALRENSTLRELGLSCWAEDVAPVDRGIVALAEALTPPSRVASSLEFLDLFQMHVGQAGSRAICTMLRENTALRVLYLPSASHGVYDFNSRAKPFAPMAPLCAALRVNNTLQQLSVSSDGTAEATIALGRALEHNKGLVWLDVAGLSLSNGGATALAAGLQRNTRLRDLMLRVKRPDRSELAVLAGAMSRTRTLARLDYDEDPGISKAGAQTLGRAVRANDCASALVTLTLHGCRDDCAAAAAGRLPFETTVL